MREISAEVRTMCDDAIASQAELNQLAAQKSSLQAQIDVIEFESKFVATEATEKTKNAHTLLTGIFEDVDHLIRGSNVAEYTGELLLTSGRYEEEAEGAKRALGSLAVSTEGIVPVFIHTRDATVIHLLRPYENDGTKEKGEVNFFVANETRGKLALGVRDQVPENVFVLNWNSGENHTNGWAVGGTRHIGTKTYGIDLHDGIITDNPRIVNDPMQLEAISGMNRDQMQSFAVVGAPAVAAVIEKVSSNIATASALRKDALRIVLSNVLGYTFERQATDVDEYGKHYAEMIRRYVSGSLIYSELDDGLPIVLHKDVSSAFKIAPDEIASSICAGLEDSARAINPPSIFNHAILRTLRSGKLYKDEQSIAALPANARGYYDVGVDKLDDAVQTAVDHIVSRPMLFDKETGQAVAKILKEDSRLLTIAAINQKQYMLRSGERPRGRKIRALAHYIEQHPLYAKTTV